MEETQNKERVVTNVEKEEVGETSRAGGCGQPGVIGSKKEEDHEKVEIVVDKPAEKKMLTVRDRLKSSREASNDEGRSSSTGNNNPENNPVIPLVPKALREKEEFKKHFEPRIISIGPYHHGKENLKAGESIKLRWTEELLKLPSARGINEDTLWDSIRGEIKELRACYDETHVKENKYDDETLAWMLFVDGCSVLYFINCCILEDFIALNLNNSDIEILKQDLILLENQLPYRVLVLLNSIVLDDFLVSLFFKGNLRIFFVAFVRFAIYQAPERELKWRPWPRYFAREWTPWSETISEEPSHLLWILRRQYTAGDSTKSTRVSKPSVTLKYRRRSFHNVTELTAKGISLKPLCHDQYDFKDIVFKNNPFLNPQLLLRPITVDGKTKTQLLNVIALEMSSSSKNRYVTSYICFLNSLIINQDDVRELREAHILYNCLGSNEELAKFFKGIADNLVPDSEIYNDVLPGIDKYLDSRRSNIWSWKTEATRTYFQSPWKAIAVFAGFLAISVTIVQTYFTIFPLPDKCNESICKYIGKNIGFGG